MLRAGWIFINATSVRPCRGRGRYFLWDCASIRPIGNALVLIAKNAKNDGAFSFLSLLLSMFVYGATKFPLKGTALTPAARGEVEVSTDKKNGNSNVKIKVEHLAPPENLTTAMIGYLVWFTEKGGNPCVSGQNENRQEPEGQL